MNRAKFFADITSFFTVLAALPYEFGDIADILPPEWKKRVFIAGLVGTLALRLLARWNGGGGGSAQQGLDISGVK